MSGRGDPGLGWCNCFIIQPGGWDGIGWGRMGWFRQRQAVELRAVSGREATPAWWMFHTGSTKSIFDILLAVSYCDKISGS